MRIVVSPNGKIGHRFQANGNGGHVVKCWRRRRYIPIDWERLDSDKALATGRIIALCERCNRRKPPTESGDASYPTRGRR